MGHFVNGQKALEYEVLSVAASNDANDKNRVLTRKLIGVTHGKIPPHPRLRDLPCHLNEAKSLEWLSENGYEIEKSLDGSITIKKDGQTKNIGHATIVGLPLEKGVSLTAFDGKIYINIKNEK